jgi:hypothetical protein
VVVVSSSQTEELKETERRQKSCLKSSCTHIIVSLRAFWVSL